MKAASEYFLARHVHACVRNGDVVILDVKTGRYMGVGAARARALAGLVSGWPVQTEGTATSQQPPGDEVRPVLQAMLERGLVTSAPGTGRGAAAALIAPARQELSPFIGPKAPVIRTHHVLHFLAALLSALLILRRASFEALVARVSRRRLQDHTGAVGERAPAFDSLVSVYNRLRLVTFSAKDHCLLDSLVLVEFLTRYGHRPEWIFGVQAAPFRAHCWVQQSDVVLNDSVANISRFTPIFAP